ncbi:unnamed protein product [marine sediment metagenome]|uniref:Uncharacterized protein n=1 Tax=marine sediment metagenome TaxID=412755 RepID=X1G1F4_9ZZZZ
MPGYPPTNLIHNLSAQKILVDTGILPANMVNFEFIQGTDGNSTFKTFNKTIHSGIYVKFDEFTANKPAGMGDKTENTGEKHLDSKDIS